MSNIFVKSVLPRSAGLLAPKVAKAKAALEAIFTETAVAQNAVIAALQDVRNEIDDLIALSERSTGRTQPQKE